MYTKKKIGKQNRKQRNANEQGKKKEKENISMMINE